MDLSFWFPVFLTNPLLFYFPLSINRWCFYLHNSISCMFHRVHFVRFLPSYITIIFYHSVPTRPTSIISSRSMTSMNAISIFRRRLEVLNQSARWRITSFISVVCESKSWRVFNSIQTFSYHVRILSCIPSSLDINLLIHPIQDGVDIHYRRNNLKDTFLW